MTTTSPQADTSTNAFSNIAAGIAVGASNVDNDSGCRAPAPSTNAVNKNLNITSSNNFPNNPVQSNNGSCGGANNQFRAADTVKRKKLKSRSATTPNSGYVKDHLDAWLETCLKDASNTQLSSSSEFLDYNPTTATTTTNSTANRNTFAQQQQQQTPLQHPSTVTQVHATSNMHNNSNHQQFAFPTHQQQQQQFALRTTQSQSQPPIGYSSGYGATPFSQGFQRNMSNFMKHSNTYNNRFPMMFPTAGGFYQQNDGSQDFTSLPPIVNMMGGSSEHENNSTDVLDGSGSNPNMCRGFSDPCLLNPSDNDSKISGQNTPDRRNAVPTEMENNKFFTALMEQINLLHETNSKICRNLHENKVDIEALKHAPSWGMRHRRDSLSGLSTHSQPMVFGGGFGTQSPAPTYHSGAYTPGMMTDVVREVKEAARVREDALLNRVKTMVEERQWSMNECNLRMMRDIEELKSQIHNLRADRKEANKRINHLEAENKCMRQMLASIFNNRGGAPDIIYENEALHTRKTFPHSRRSQSLNLHYGTIHQQPASSPLSVVEQEEPLHIIETPSTTSTVDIAAANPRARPSDMRNSFSSSDGGGGGGTAPLQNGSDTIQLLSPPNFALVSTPVDEVKRKREKSSKKIDVEPLPPNESTQELRRELTEAVTARKEADDRIIALEKLVKNLQVNATSIGLLANGDGNNVGGGIINAMGTPHDAFKWQLPQPTFSVPNSSKKHHQAHTIASTSVNMVHSVPKLSVAGPITDL